MKRTLSLMLALVLLVGLMPMGAVAIEEHTHVYENGVCTGCGEVDPDYRKPAWGTWVAFGTSITEDKDYMRPGATNIKGTYIPYLSELLGVDAPDANYSIGGAAFSTHLLMYMYYAKYQKYGLTYNGYTHTAIKNADLITIEGGVNDFYGSVPLGKVGDTVPYSKADPITVNPNSTNNFGGTTEGTFAGCIYAAITELRRVAPDATIVFITDNAGTGSCAATKANALGHYLHDYNDVMTAVAESMGCYVIDAGRTAGFEENLKTYLSDHIHHSEAGGEAYANAIWKGLCAIADGENPESGHTHRYTETVTAPTCTEKGYTTYTCICGGSYEDNYTDAVGHSYADGICTICGEKDSDDTEPVWDTWVAFGTSITEDKDYMRPGANVFGTYIPHLSELMGVDAPDANYSIAGAGFTTHLLMYIHYAKYQKDGLTYNGYTHTAIKNADLITIEGGVNDFYSSVPLGKVGDTLPYSKADPITVNPNSTNNFGGTTEGTFAGCIYAAITELRRVAPDATIVFITDNAGTGPCAATKANALGYYLYDYNDMMIAVAESMGCYVIDAGRTAGFEENLKTYLYDHINHSEAGGEAYANAIWKGLCAIADGEKPESGHTHRYTGTIMVPTCTQQGYTTYACICGDSYVGGYVDATGDHVYENGACTGCGEAHPNLANYKGKVISVLGDSISTFAGYIPTADGFNLEHSPRYPQDNLLTDVNETWWMQLLAVLDANLGINESWRSTEVYNYIDEEVNSSYDGTKACMASTTRIQNLGSNGTPDVILFFGGTNDITQSRPVGTFDHATAPTEVDLTSVKWDTVADAYVDAIMRMQYYYPDAQIVALLPFDRSSQGTAKVNQYNSLFLSICEHYGVPSVDLRESGISNADLPDGTHPDAIGMDYITDAVLDVLMSDCNVEAGEHIVHSVTHDLNSAKSTKGYYKGVSHGKPFSTEIIGENLKITVTMCGADITDSVLENYNISIPQVTGDVSITVAGREKTIYEDYLQHFPDELCCGVNLWNALDRQHTYYKGSSWGNNGDNAVYSVTIPIVVGDQIWATSFQANPANGNTSSSSNGIRITWFDEDGVLKSMSTGEVYSEFRTNGYLTAPDGAVAVNIPMWNNSDDNELYILNRDHVYENGACTGCGMILGDADGDGEIAAMDAILLSQYLAGWDVTLNEVSADTDGDGAISAMDAILLSQYLAGWDVTLGPQTRQPE